MKIINLAKQIGASPQAISNIVNGRRRASWDMGKRLAAATGTDIALWIEGDKQDRRAAVIKTNGGAK